MRGRPYEVVRLLRADERTPSSGSGTQTLHAFSSGAHFDPGNLLFGPLVALDEHAVEAGAGFGAHAHAGLDLVTWVLDGELVHEDSTGSRGVLRAGWLQRLSSGSGVRHVERAGGDAPVRFVQAWLVPDDPTAAPSWAVADVPAASGFVAAAGECTSLALGAPGAVLLVGRLGAGETAELPGAPLLHVHVTRGSAVVVGVAGEPELSAGDTLRCSAAVPAPVPVRAGEGGAEVLVWRFER